MTDECRATANPVVDPYAIAVRRRLEEFHTGLSADLNALPSLPRATALGVLRYLLEVSCQAQHIGNINAGRRVFAMAPRQWLLATLPEVVDVLDLNDEWEFRRYVELTSFLDPQCAEHVVHQALTSERPDIREAARDMAGHCGEFAQNYRSSVGGPPW